MSIAVATRDAAEGIAPVPLRFHICPRGGAWHLNEETQGAIGGIFFSQAAAIAFALEEGRFGPGATVVVEHGEGPTKSAA
jgi:hypothetical protein